MNTRRTTTVLAVASLALLTACWGLSARQKALLPVIQGGWVGVKIDLERGVPRLDAEIAALEVGIQEGSPKKIAAVEWPRLAASAIAGAAARVEKGEISVGVAASLGERISNFGESLTTFVEK